MIKYHTTKKKEVIIIMESGKMSLHLPERLQQRIFQDALRQRTTIPFMIIQKLCMYFKIPVSIKRRSVVKVVVPRTPRVTLVLSKQLLKAIKLEQKRKKLVSVSATLQILLVKLYGLPLEVLSARKKVKMADWRKPFKRERKKK